MSITSLSPQQLRQAADLKEKIDGLQVQLNEILGSEVSPLITTQGPKKGRRKISAEGRARIAAAQKARWAKVRSESGSKQASGSPTKPKRHISAALRKARSEAMKARWAKARRAGKSRP
jgi:hypothetical protein